MAWNKDQVVCIEFSSIIGLGTPEKAVCHPFVRHKPDLIPP
jgi:hypothetical protein